MKKISLYLCAAALAVLLSGCRALPEGNYIGMTRDQVLDVVAKTPTIDRGKASEFHVSVPTGSSDPGANCNLYFKTPDELRRDKRVRSAHMLGIFYRSHWSGFTFYYELTLRNDRVVRQRIAAYSDGVTLLPAWMFYDYPGERRMK